MADLQTTYTLVTPGPDITFNQGPTNPFDTTDKYWISNIQGLDGPMIRAPVDMVPFGNGGIVHTFWKGPRRVIIDGWLIVNSSTSQDDCVQLRYALSSNLASALASIIAASGTLSWTPAGAGALSLTVYNEVPLTIQHSDDYRVATFNFGLISEAADPA